MRTLTISKNDAGQRLDKFLTKALCDIPPALLSPLPAEELRAHLL